MIKDLLKFFVKICLYTVSLFVVIWLIVLSAEAIWVIYLNEVLKMILFACATVVNMLIYYVLTLFIDGLFE